MDLHSIPSVHAGIMVLSIYYQNLLVFVQYFVFFRPHNGRKHSNQSDDEYVDGGLSSKTSGEGASECSVADFLRKEATSNSDFRCFGYFP